MRGLLVCAILLMVGACGPRPYIGPPEAYRHWKDRLIVRIGLPQLFGMPCMEEIKFVDGTTGQTQAPTERCFRMTEPKRWKGVWHRDFELSQFCPRTRTDCLRDHRGTNIWLTSAAVGPKVIPDIGYGLSEVEFIGRRTVYPGYFGHGNGFEHEMIVDRWLSVRQIPGGEGVQGGE